MNHRALRAALRNKSPPWAALWTKLNWAKEQRLSLGWTWKLRPSLGQTWEQQPSLGLTWEHGTYCRCGVLSGGNFEEVRDMETKESNE